MNKLQQLLDQKVALEKEIDTTRRQQKSDGIEKVRAMMTEYGLTAADLVQRSGPKAGAAKAGKGAKVAPKFRDALTESAIDAKQAHAVISANFVVTEALRLSRENTNVISFDVSVHEKRLTTKECLLALAALEEAVLAGAVPSR